MAKANTKQNKTKAGITNKNNKGYICTIAILALLSAGLLGALIATATQVMTGEEKEYLDVYEHLMSRYPEMKCDIEDNVNVTLVQDEDGEYVGVVKDEEVPDTRTCMMTGYGVSKDGDPYVSYTETRYNPKTHEQKGEPKNFTLYFQHHNGGYAEALGED